MKCEFHVKTEVYILNKIINKKELVKIVKKHLEEGFQAYYTDYWDVWWFINAFCDSLIEIMENGDTLKLTNAFIMEPVFRKGKRKVVHGKEIFPPDKYGVKFRPMNKLRKAAEQYGQNMNAKQEELEAEQEEYN